MLQYVKDSILVVSIAIMYVIFFEKAIEVSYQNLSVCDRNSRKFVTMFSLGLFTIGITRYYKEFEQIKILQDKVVRDGLSLGGILLASKVTISYWGQMDDKLRLVVFAFGFTALLFYARGSRSRTFDDSDFRQERGRKVIKK